MGSVHVFSPKRGTTCLEVEAGSALAGSDSPVTNAPMTTAAIRRLNFLPPISSASRDRYHILTTVTRPVRRSPSLSDRANVVSRLLAAPSGLWSQMTIV
jgi:hypothetical protein